MSGHPRWLEPALRAVNGLADLEGDWDAQGARTIDRRVLSDAANLLPSIMRSGGA